MFGPETHELIKGLLLLRLVFRNNLLLFTNLLIWIEDVGRVAARWFCVCWSWGVVVDDAYLLRLNDVLPEDIIIGVAGLNILHPGRRSDQAELI